MAGKRAFPVVCVVLTLAQQLNAIVPPFLPLRPMRRYGPAFPNEILGSGPTFRPPPGLLIAGHNTVRPGARPLGPVHHGGRPFPFLPSSSPPTPSMWPNTGPQIQRAQEARHFEYEVVAPPMNLPKPPTLLRPAPRFPVRPMPAPHHSPGIPREIIQILGQDSYPIQARTERPPMSITGPPNGANPPFVTPSAADFQEGYRILSDIFMENAGADIRSNLIGGSDVSFNGGFSPRSTTSSPMKRNVTLPQNTAELVQIVQADEKPILIAAGTPENNPNEIVGQPQPVYVRPTEKPTQMQGSESAYGPPQIQMGPAPASHVSYMFTDPNEPPAGSYNLYEDSPPPPFNLGGNSIIPPPTPSPPQGPNPNARPPSLHQLPPQAQSAPQFNNGPPTQQGGKIIRNELPPLPPLPPNNGQRPFVMVPVGAASNTRNTNEPVPSSDEVQQALSVLARYASKQAQNMGMNVTPQMILQQEGAPPHLMKYDSPPPPGGRYGPPPASSQPPQQSTTISTYLPPATTTVESVTYGAPIHLRGPSAPYSTTSTTETNTITSQPEESSPFPRYGPPSRGATGGWSSGGGGGGGNDLIGAKVQALKTIQSAVTGGFKSITGLKAGILNAGLSAIGNFNRAKGDLANSLKIPIVSNNKKPSPIYGAPSQPAPSYGPPQSSPPNSNYGPPSHSPNPEGPISTIVNAVGDVVGGITGTIAQTGRAAVGIGLSKNELIKNHFVIKGQAFTDVVSKKVANKNQYFQNVMKHIQSIFDAATQRPATGGWSSSPPGGY